MDILDTAKPDKIATWIEIYTAGGEPLLREWSNLMTQAGRLWAKPDYTPDEHHGLRIAQTLVEVAKSADEIIQLLPFIPVTAWPGVLDGDVCSFELLERLWYNPLYCTSRGEPTPHSGSSKAFFSQYQMAIEFYIARPDLHHLIHPAMKPLYEYGVKKRNSTYELAS